MRFHTTLHIPVIVEARDRLIARAVAQHAAENADVDLEGAQDIFGQWRVVAQADASVGNLIDEAKIKEQPSSSVGNSKGTGESDL